MMAFRKRWIFRQGRSVAVRTILFIGLLLLAGCKAKTPPPPPPPQVAVVQPVQQRVTDYLELTGNTQAIRTVQLVARVSGYLDMVLFQDGQLVREGQSLFLIQQNTYQDNLRQAEAAISQYRAQLEYAGAQFTRYSNLVQQKAASQSDVDNWQYQKDLAQANLRSAEAQRDLAKLNLSYTDVRAPFDGRIDRRLRDPGNLVGAGENTVLAELNQIDPIYVYFTISDADLARLTEEAHWVPGKSLDRKWPIFAGVLNEKGYPHKGQLDFASISLTVTTGTLLMRGTFPNPDGKILPGLYSRLHVPVKEGPALLVPQEAIGYDQRGPYVLAVNEKQVVQRVTIKIGAQVDHLRVVEEGLTGKEWVVTKGIQNAIPGKQVMPERERPGGSAAPASRAAPTPQSKPKKGGR